MSTRPELHLDVTNQPDGLRIAVTGDVDAHTAPQLEGEILAGLFNPAAHRLELDVAAVSFIDSSGLRVIISAIKLLRERDGRFVLLHPNETVRNLLEVTNLTGEIDILI
jgi:anti-sigma B factor antagonist